VQVDARIGRTAVTIKLAVVAKHLLEREGLARLVARSPQFDVIGAASSASELARATDGTKPDVVVVVVGGSHGTDAPHRSDELPELDPDTALVVLAQRPDGELAGTLLAQRRAGRGYLISQRQDLPRLLDAIKRVVSGETVLGPDVVDALIASRRDVHGVSRMQRLTPREREVLAAIADGLSNSSIASSLEITMRGVERHVGVIYRKLALRGGDDVDRRVAAALLYLKDSAARG
jgi:DNA-binding NarL/FixJ family response regulator